VSPLRVVVNADDLGMSLVVNDAIFAALAAGTCTSASLLATGPAADDALRRARAAGLAVGVHLDLSGFRSLTGGPGRLVRDGAFRGDPRAVTPEDAAEALTEWRAQVARVRDAGVVVDHLDGHHHVHQLPALAGALRVLCAETGIRRVRGMGALRAPNVGTRVGAALQQLRAARFRAALRRDGLVTTDGFAPVGVFLARAADPRWRPTWETLELMAHPGNPHHAHYQAELEALGAGALAGLPFPVTPVGWSAV